MDKAIPTCRGIARRDGHSGLISGSADVTGGDEPGLMERIQRDSATG
jgi:hypothetical protein